MYYSTLLQELLGSQCTGGIGIGYGVHTNLVVVVDETSEIERRLEKCLTNDPGIGVVRHLAAGYDEAIEVAAEKKIDIPVHRKCTLR